MVNKILILADNLHNIGDLALLCQTVAGIKSATGITEIAVRQWARPSEAAIKYAVEQGCMLARSKWQFMFSPGCFAVVGGGQFIRNNVSISSLIFMIFTLATSNRPAAALAIGGGAVDGRLRRFLWRVLLARFAVITFRDNASQALVDELLPHRARCDVTCDLAFSSGPLLKALIAGGAIGPVVVAPCFSQEEDRIIDAAWVARMCVGLAAHFGAGHVSILPHDDRPDVDRPICAQIGNELKALKGPTPELLTDVTMAMALEAYRSCAVVLTNRLHSMIFALLACKPVLVIDDGNLKLKAYAERFVVALLPQGCGIDELTRALIHEGSPAVRSARASAVSFARSEASRNFHLLRDYCH